MRLLRESGYVRVCDTVYRTEYCRVHIRSDPKRDHIGCRITWRRYRRITVDKHQDQTKRLLLHASVAASLGVETEELQWKNTKTKPKDYYFMRHFLAINDFRILLKEACDESDVNLLGFIPEYLGEKNRKGGMRKYIRDVGFS